MKMKHLKFSTDQGLENGNQSFRLYARIESENRVNVPFLVYIISENEI